MKKEDDFEVEQSKQYETGYANKENTGLQPQSDMGDACDPFIWKEIFEFLNVRDCLAVLCHSLQRRM